MGKREWVENGCSSRKKARNSAAGVAYPDVKRLCFEYEKRGGENGGYGSKTGWEFFISVGHKFVGGAFVTLYTKVFLLVQFLFR